MRTKQRLCMYHQDTVKFIKLSNFSIDNVNIKLSSSVHNVGIIFYNIMLMSEQVTSICKTTHLHFLNIGCIRKCISYERHWSMLLSPPGLTGNGNLYDLPDFQSDCLQSILHIAARILTLSSPSCNITPILIVLHWLPIKKRIEYKILTPHL